MESTLKVSAKIWLSVYASYAGCNVMDLTEEGMQEEDLNVDKSRHVFNCLFWMSRPFILESLFKNTLIKNDLLVSLIELSENIWKHVVE